AQITRGTARDPEQEGVEDDDEAELQRDRDRREIGHTRRQSPGSQRTSKISSTAPSSITSPSCSRVGTPTGRPLSLTPFVESRSVSVQPSRSGAISAWWRETSCAAITMSASLLRPITAPRRPADVEVGLANHLAGQWWLGRRRHPGATRHRGRRRVDQLCLDATLAEREAFVRAPLDLGARGQREPFGAGVLQQVGRKLLDQALLDRREVATIAG